MEYIANASARVIKVAPEFTIYEYGQLGNGLANGTVAEINGRYPQKGWGRNLRCDELVYVISGKGFIEFQDARQELNPGDVALIPKGRFIAWIGDALKVFIPCIPAWTPDQHELISE